MRTLRRRPYRGQCLRLRVNAAWRADPQGAILQSVQTVYTTDLGLPEGWTDGPAREFVDDEADKIAWMARAHAATLGERSTNDWTRADTAGQLPNQSTQTALRTQARAQAVRQVLSTELDELIPTETDD